jgi:hypothetical protein
MKRIVRWVALVVLILAAAGFVAFLYFIPPLMSTAPEEFINAEEAMAPPVDGIADPAVPEMYLAGGRTFATAAHGTVVSRNLTPDAETGLARRTDEDVKRVLRSGVYPDGRPISHMAMPWAQFSNLSDEDLHAVVVYLRHIKPVRHEIPPPAAGNASDVVPGAVEVVYGVDGGRK